MRVLVIGSGGREHAIIKKIKDNKKIDKLYCLPGNGGIAEDAECVNIGAKELDKIGDFAEENRIDYAIVTPDDPLVLGLVDLLEARGIACFGPNKAAALIEGSKAFSKGLMKKYGIPTASYEVFRDMDRALAYLDGQNPPIVVKASGLALGKGVIIAETIEEAREAVKSMMEDRVFGESGSEIVIEEYLRGPEVTVLTFTDGNTLVPMVSSMDHKRIGEGDKGLNTGGMGVIAPNPFYTKEIAERCMNEIFLPTIRAMKKEGRPFSGCLYFGLMITEEGPKVIEYNCRFGDPETQAILPLLKTDLFDIMLHVTEGSLEDIKVEFSDQASCCIILASSGYPVKYEKGFKIDVPDGMDNIYYAGVKAGEDGKLITSGGRVLGVTCTGRTLKEAVESAYEDISKLNFDNKYFRRDIGRRALEGVGGK
jgi:phosphoribosylamine--glycine ligase